MAEILHQLIGGLSLKESFNGNWGVLSFKKANKSQIKGK